MLLIQYHFFLSAIKPLFNNIYLFSAGFHFILMHIHVEKRFANFKESLILIFAT